MKPLPLHPGAQPCVGSGFCCSRTPCPFGEPVSETNQSCKFLELRKDIPAGKRPRYICGKFDEIVGQPGWEMCPAFGAGCCSSLFNEDRDAILKEEQLERSQL